MKPNYVGMNTGIIDSDVIYRAYQRIFNNLDVSLETKIDYQIRSTEFFLFLENKGLHTDSLLRYKEFLDSDKRLAASTKNKKLTVARLFLKELHRSGVVPRDVAGGVKNFKQSGLHKTNGLDDKDMRKIRAWMHDGMPVTHKRIRIYAVLMLLTYHGLREIEVCRLRYEDIDFSRGVAMVHGKGQHDKERVHLHKAVVSMLQKYCAEYGIQSGPLLFSVSNNSYGSPLTTRSLRRLVMAVFERLEIDKTPHGCRHYYTTKLVKAYRGDLFRVMQFTRHKSLSMLQTYNDEILHEQQYPIHDRIFAGVL
ncbi:MAG: tyrosine-type recombinase/integrase [Candidatus Saccharimonadales bacterium]